MLNHLEWVKSAEHCLFVPSDIKGRLGTGSTQVAVSKPEAPRLLNKHCHWALALFKGGYLDAVVSN